MDLKFISDSALAAPESRQNEAAKEALQRCLMASLAQDGLLASVSFIGGTALRLLHGLPRYSEDLDFIAHDVQSIGDWKVAVAKAFSKLGVIGNVQAKVEMAGPEENKRIMTILTHTSPGELLDCAPRGLQIRLEIDLDPPRHTERTKGVMQVGKTPFDIPTLSLPSLMAGKLHVLLARKDREKGRDWFDYLWYRQRDILPNVAQLESAITARQKALCPDARFWMSYLRQRIIRAEWEHIQKDARVLLADASQANHLNLVRMNEKTPPPDFAGMTPEFVKSLPVSHPVIADLHQYCMEGNIDAISLRFDAGLQ